VLIVLILAFPIDDALALFKKMENSKVHISERLELNNYILSQHPSLAQKMEQNQIEINFNNGAKSPFLTTTSVDITHE
jgi:hypothetical protein